MAKEIIEEILERAKISFTVFKVYEEEMDYSILKCTRFAFGALN